MKKKAKKKTARQTSRKTAKKRTVKKSARRSVRTAHRSSRKSSTHRSKTILSLHKKPKIAPSGKVSPLTGHQISQFREVLTQKRDDLLAVVERKKQEEESFETSLDAGGDEADIATQSVEKEMLYELTDSEKQTLDKIEDALIKIEKGSYGHCESCQGRIPHLRLEVMPWARYCIHCQSEQEVPPAE